MLVELTFNIFDNLYNCQEITMKITEILEEQKTKERLRRVSENRCREEIKRLTPRVLKALYDPKTKTYNKINVTGPFVFSESSSNIVFYSVGVSVIKPWFRKPYIHISEITFNDNPYFVHSVLKYLVE